MEVLTALLCLLTALINLLTSLINAEHAAKGKRKRKGA